MEIRLDGRTAIITGGSKGLGLAIATEFAASGADVAILARDQTALDDAAHTIAKTARGRVQAFSCDVSKADEITRAHALVTDAFGTVDILVNNAGTSRTMAFEQVTDAIWQEDLDLKLFAAIRMTRLVWPGMTQRNWGRVINVLNIGAKAPTARSAPTTISRAAGLALTKVLAGEGRAPQRAGQRADGRRHRQRPMGQTTRRRRQQRTVLILHRRDRRRRADGAHGRGRRVRQHRLLPGLGRSLLHHRNLDQRRRRPVAGRLTQVNQATPTVLRRRDGGAIKLDGMQGIGTRLLRGSRARVIKLSRRRTQRVKSAAGGKPVPGNSARSLKIISWNLLRLVGASLADVARLIETEQPDLMLMQEATDVMDGLPGRIGGYYARAPLPGRIHGLAMWSPIPFHTPPATVALPSGTLVHRVCQIVDLGELSIANVHLSHGQVLNRRQLRSIAQSLPACAAVLGDYNLLGPALLPGFRDVGPRHHTHVMVDLWPLRIDRCLVRGLRCLETATLPRHTSDHRPILVRLALAHPAIRAAA